MTDTMGGVIPISSIKIGKRLRNEYGDIEELAESAEGIIGQIQSITVCETGEEELPYELIAGERRLRAFKLRGMETVFARIYPKLDDYYKKTIELYENTKRLGMTFVEEVMATDEVHQLSIKLYGQRSPGSPKDSGWSMAKTGELLKMDKSQVSRDLKLAKALIEIPELKNCKTKREAENIMAKVEEDLLIAELARRAQQATPKNNVDQLKRCLVDSYIVGDFFELAPKIPDSCIDFVDLDPPYGIDYDKLSSMNAKESATSEAFSVKDFAEFRSQDFESKLETTLLECYRTMKENSWLILWYAQHPWAEVCFQLLLKCGFEVYRIPAIWCKSHEGSDMRFVANPNQSLGHVYETFYYARKGHAQIRTRARADVFHFPTPPSATRIHPTEKPQALLEEILTTFALPGARVLVPFLGSGNTILAAAAKDMTAFGYDLGQAYKDKFSLRVMER